jgi:hypothetical protein
VKVANARGRQARLAVLQSRAFMSLSPGTRLGPYEIQLAIGAGGPVFARSEVARELRRGLAEADLRIRP